MQSPTKKSPQRPLKPPSTMSAESPLTASQHPQLMRQTSANAPNAIKKFYKREHKRNLSVPEEVLMTSAFRKLQPAPARLHDLGNGSDTVMRDVPAPPLPPGGMRFTTTHTMTQLTMDFGRSMTPPNSRSASMAHSREERIFSGHCHSNSLGGIPYSRSMLGGGMQNASAPRRSSMMHPQNMRMNFGQEGMDQHENFYGHSQSRSENLPTPPHTAPLRTMSPFDLAPLPNPNSYLSMTSMALDGSIPATSQELDNPYFAPLSQQQYHHHVGNSMKEPDDIQSSLAMYQFPVSSSAAQVTPVSVTSTPQKMALASAGSSMHHHQLQQHHQQQSQVRIPVQTSLAPLSVPASATILPKQEQQQRSRLPPLAPAPSLGTTSANTTPPAESKPQLSSCSPSSESRKRSPPEPPTNPTNITLEEITSYISGPSPPDNKYICLYPDCHKRFGRKENIKSHVQTHLGDRQYKCAVCKKCFVRQHDLKRHAKIHTGVKPYPCACGNSFARHDALTRHRQRGMCIGAFEGVVKKVVKRGRPRKKPLEATGAGQATINANTNNGNSTASSAKLKKESLPRLKLESKSVSPAPSSSDSTCPDENHIDDYDGQPPSPLSENGGDRGISSSMSYSTGGNPSTTSFDFSTFISPPTSASTSSISLVSSSTTTPGESHHHHSHSQHHQHPGHRDSGKSQLNSPLGTPEMMGTMKTVVVTTGPQYDYPPVSTPTGMSHGHAHHSHMQQHQHMSYDTVDPLELEGFGVNDAAWSMGSMGWGNDGVANWVG